MSDVPPDYYCAWGRFHPVVRLAQHCTVHDPEREQDERTLGK